MVAYVWSISTFHPQTPLEIMIVLVLGCDLWTGKTRERTPTPEVFPNWPAPTRTRKTRAHPALRTPSKPLYGQQAARLGKRGRDTSWKEEWRWSYISHLHRRRRRHRRLENTSQRACPVKHRAKGGLVLVSRVVFVFAFPCFFDFLYFQNWKSPSFINPIELTKMLQTHRATRSPISAFSLLSKLFSAIPS